MPDFTIKDESGWSKRVMREVAQGAFTPTNATLFPFTPFMVDIPRSHDRTGDLLIACSLGSALSKANDKLYAYHLNKLNGLWYPVRENWNDTDPANLWEAADGLTGILLTVPVRLAPVMAFGITMATGKQITLGEELAFRWA